MKKLVQYFTFALVSISLTSCFSVKEVEVKQVESVNLISMTDSTADLAVNLRVYNPNKMKIKVKSCDLDAFINNKYIGKVNIAEEITLPKKSEFTQTVLVKADMNQVKKIMPSLMFSSKALVNLKGDMRVKAKGINKKIAVNIDEKISRKDLKNLTLAKGE